MKYLLHLLLPLIVASATVRPLQAAGEAGEWLLWTSTANTTVSAEFVSLFADKVTLRLQKNGSTYTVPLEKLVAASQRQAHREAARKADQPIAALRSMVFVRIPSGRFEMGSPIGEPGRVTNGETAETRPAPSIPKGGGVINELIPDYEPLHRVDIKRDFWMKQTEVTWAEWNAVLEFAVNYGYPDIGSGANGYEGDASGRHPVTNITWLDAIKWCNLKSQIESKNAVYHIGGNFNGSAIFKTGTLEPLVNWEADGYRLPTEAEWEYACREGRGSKRFHADLNSIAWFAGNSGGNTHPVGTRNEKPHQYGLQDMHGNVAEWCWDWAGLLTPGKTSGPQRGPTKGSFRIFRGGSWADPERCCRAAYRGTFSPAAPASHLVGFRPVCGSDPALRPNP